MEEGSEKDKQSQRTIEEGKDGYWELRRYWALFKIRFVVLEKRGIRAGGEN